MLRIRIQIFFLIRKSSTGSYPSFVKLFQKVVTYPVGPVGNQFKNFGLFKFFRSRRYRKYFNFFQVKRTAEVQLYF